MTAINTPSLRVVVFVHDTASRECSSGFLGGLSPDKPRARRARFSAQAATRERSAHPTGELAHPAVARCAQPDGRRARRGAASRCVCARGVRPPYYFRRSPRTRASSALVRGCTCGCECGQGACQARRGIATSARVGMAERCGGRGDATSARARRGGGDAAGGAWEAMGRTWVRVGEREAGRRRASRARCWR